MWAGQAFFASVQVIFLSGYGDQFLGAHTFVRMLLASTAPYQLLHLSRQNSEIGEQSRI